MIIKQQDQTMRKRQLFSVRVPSSEACKWSSVGNSERGHRGRFQTQPMSVTASQIVFWTALYLHFTNNQIITEVLKWIFIDQI